MSVAERLKNEDTERSVMFLGLTAEESGLLGSAYLAENFPFDYSQIVAGMNFDIKIGIFEGENLIGGFRTVIYDHFGDLSVTTWGTELSSDDVILLKEKNSE